MQFLPAGIDVVCQSDDGAAAMHRVVKRKGKVAVMVWSTVDRNPFRALPLKIVRRIGDIRALAHSHRYVRTRYIGLLTDMYQKVGFHDLAIHPAVFVEGITLMR